MNGPSGIMSPISVDGSDWSGINQYQNGSNKSEPPFSPTYSNRGNMATPPTSVGPLGLPPPAGGPGRRLTDSGNPSPPSSVAARSSNGTLSEQQQNGRRQYQIEELLSQHYMVLRRFLQGPNRDDRANPNKSNKARDKLLRLSPTQFQELSTDVYDELLRRQQASARTDIPPFLPPRDEFHEKRNQARQKLASLQHQRFRDLATDVFCELERRFPNFAARDIPRKGSPSPSMRSTASRGPPPNGYPPRSGYGPPPGPNGFPGERRSQSRGPPPGRMGRGYPSGGPPMSPMGSSFPPRQGSLGAAPPPLNGDGAPLAKSFQSNTIVPNKSTLVEDDDDAGAVEDEEDEQSDSFALDNRFPSRRDTGTTLGDGERRLLIETQAQVSVLMDKVDKLEDLVKAKDEELAKLHQQQEQIQASNSERQEWEELKSELEEKLLKAEDLNSSLQQELDKVRTDQETMEQDLRKQMTEAVQTDSGASEWESRYRELETRHLAVHTELQDQRQVTEQVRQEASNFLKEMKALSEQSQSNWEREELLSSQNERLEKEVEEWKERYAKMKAQLRSLKASSVGISGLLPNVATQTNYDELLEPSGCIKDVHVTRFQLSIDELLRVARYEQPPLVLDQMKVAIFAVRHILQDVAQSLSPGEEGMDPACAKSKGKVSTTANNLITASKNFAYSNGLSPVSLLDAAASHLCTAIVQLIRLVKIRPTSAEDLDDDEDMNLVQLQSPDYFSVVPSVGRYSNNESVYSAISSPSTESRRENSSSTSHGNSDVSRQLRESRDGQVGGVAASSNSVSGQEHDYLRELKLYLDEQTDSLVQLIQDLVASIRGDEDHAAILRHTSAISSIVTNIVSSADHAIQQPGSSVETQQRCGSILQALYSCQDRLMEAAAEGDEAVVGAEEARELTGKLPPLAFELARHAKELVQCFDQSYFDGRQLGGPDDEDDFR